MMMPFAEDATAFVRSGVLRSPFVITRAQTGGVQSTAINGGNDGLTFYGPDVPRFTEPTQRLLLEGQRTNSIRNPLGEGAVTGAPGTLPTNWARYLVPGLSSSVVGQGIESNIPYVDIRVNGTTATLNSFFLRFDENYPAAAVGQLWTGSIFIRLIGGTLSNIDGVFISLPEWSAGPIFLGQNFTTINVNAATMLNSRQSFSTTLAQPLTTLVGLQMIFAKLIGAIDCTFRIAAPHLEQGAFNSSQIFPPVGTPGTSTRGVDLVSSTLANLGIAATGACTVLWSGVVPNFIAGATHTIACLDDGSVNNRFTMRVDQASGQLQAQRSLAGASTTANAGAVTAGAAIKGGMAINGSGRAAVSLNGGVVAAVTGGPSSGLTQSRLGNIFDGSAPMWGETSQFRILPFVSDAELQSLVSALP